MELIVHRRNTLEALAATPASHGVEVDIRTTGSRLIVHHEPFEDGVAFEAWLDGFHHGTLILNVKEDGLEDTLLGLMRERGIERFFFLDQAFPSLVKCARHGERRCAVRVSEFESVETALLLAPHVDWAWIDCFTHLALSAVDAARLTAAGLRLCLVSPELQGRHAPDGIAELRQTLIGLGMTVDAVCTKRPDLWADPID